MAKKKANPSEFRGFGDHLIQIRVEAHLDVVSQVAEIVARLIDARSSFELAEVSDIYLNRPPQDNRGRIYLKFSVVKPD